MSSCCPCFGGDAGEDKVALTESDVKKSQENNKTENAVVEMPSPASTPAESSPAAKDASEQLDLLEADLRDIEKPLKTASEGPSRQSGQGLHRQMSHSVMDALGTFAAKLQAAEEHVTSLKSDSTISSNEVDQFLKRVETMKRRLQEARQANKHRVPLEAARPEFISERTSRMGRPAVNRAPSAIQLNTDAEAFDIVQESSPKAKPVVPVHDVPVDDALVLEYERGSQLFDKAPVDTEAADAQVVPTTLYSWGRSDCGALFHADDQPHSPSEPVGFSSKDTHVVDFSASLYHAAIVTRSGGLRTCGQNEEGMVSPDSTETVFDPAPLPSLASFRIAKVACGLYHTAVLTDKGTVMTFGANKSGQLGHSEGSISRVAPKVVTGLENQEISQIVCGELFTLALSSKLQVYSWGSPDSTGHPAGIKTEQALRIREFIGMPVSRLAAGAAHAMAITMTGHVYSWGRNTHGQTGVHEVNEEGQPLGDQAIIQTPQMMKRFVDPVAGDEFTDAHTGQVHIGDAACGESHTILLDTEGQLWGCGRNNKGQLGMGDREGCRVPTHMQVGGDDTTFIQIACGSNHTLALSSDRDLFVSGAQHASDDLKTFQMVQEVSKATLKQPIVLIGAGGSQSMVLTAFREDFDGDDELLEDAALGRRFSHISFVGLGEFHLSTGFVPPTAAIGLPAGVFEHPSSHRRRLDAALDSLKEEDNRSDPDCVKEAIVAARLAFTSGSILSGVALKKPQLMRRQDSKKANQGLQGHAKDRVDWSTHLDLAGLDAMYGKILDISGEPKAEPDLTGLDVSNLVDHLSQGLLNTIHDLFGKLDPKTENFQQFVPLGCESGPMRSVLAIWQCPLLTRDTPVLREALLTFVKGVDMTFARSKPNRRKLLQALVADAADFPELFQRFLEPLLVAIERTLTPELEFQPESFRASVRVLNLLSTVNEWHAARMHELIVPDDAFVSKAVTDLPIHLIVGFDENGEDQYAPGPLFLDFARFTDPQRKNFSQFCRFPFLLRADTKRELLRVEALISQQAAGSQAMRQQNLTAVLLNPQQSVLAQFLILGIEREKILQSAVQQLEQHPDADLKKELKIVFIGEEGVDAGGVRKEFFQLLISELFFTHSGLFTSQESGDLWFNLSCVWGDEQYKLVGMLIGLALYNGVLLDLHFPTVVFKKLLPDPRLTLRDVSDLDPELAKGLRQLLDYEPAEDVEYIFCRTFEATWMHLGEEQRTALKPGGADIAVTGENRKEFVELYVRWLLEDSVAQQFAAFKQGFDRVMGDATLQLLRPEDLEAIVIGTPNLDFEELKNVTEYEGGFSADTPMIQQFWEVIFNLSDENQRKFLMFVTGSVKAPIGGLSKLPFKIQRMSPDSDQLPTSHTCFNTLLIPEYSNKEKIEKLLLYSIQECEGFGLA